MDDYLAKPIRAAELLAAIEGLVPTRPSLLQGDLAGRDGTDSLLSASTLLAACGDDETGLRELCQDFQTYAPARLSEVRDALRDLDSPRLHEAAHKLAGLLSAFSRRAGDLASELETLAALNQLDQAPQLIGRLETLTNELIRRTAGLSIETLRCQS